MLSKSKLKTWLKRKGFKPTYGDTYRDCLKCGVLSKNGRYYRFRSNEHEFEGGEKRWTVDVSCPIDDFDRWANSCDEHAVELEEFMKRY